MDFLAASLSFIDKIGHQFGSCSIADGGCLHKIIEREKVFEINVEKDVGGNGVFESRGRWEDLGLW